MSKGKKRNKLRKKNKRMEKRRLRAGRHLPDTLLGRAKWFYRSDGGAVVLPGEVEGVKMSEVIEDFVSPFSEFATTMDEFRVLLTVGLVAWNVALFPEDKRSAMLTDMLAKLPSSVSGTVRDLVHELIGRKDRLFSQYRRFVVDFELTNAGGRWQLFVVSTPGV